MSFLKIQFFLTVEVFDCNENLRENKLLSPENY